MRLRGLVLLLSLIICAVTPVAIYVFVRANTDRVAPPSQGEIRAELAAFGAKAQSGTFRVQFNPEGQDLTWYQDGELRLRLDLNGYADDGTPTRRTFIENENDSFSCREPGICKRRTNDLFDYGSKEQKLEGLFTVVLSSFWGAGTGSDEVELFRRTDRIAGVSATCFADRSPTDYRLEICFDEAGAPLRFASTHSPSGATGGYEAVEVTHVVDATDFEPPYPLVQ